MLQFPAFMQQMPSPPLIPTSTLLPVSAPTHNDEDSLALLEAEFMEKALKFLLGCTLVLLFISIVAGLAHWRKYVVEPGVVGLLNQWGEMRKININLPVIGKKVSDNKEELDAGVDDDDVDNVGESEGDEFEQETG